MEKLGKKLDHSLVSFALQRWSGKRKFESIAENACDGIFSGPEMHSDFKLSTLGRVCYGNHEYNLCWGSIQTIKKILPTKKPWTLPCSFALIENCHG